MIFKNKSIDTKITEILNEASGMMMTDANLDNIYGKIRSVIKEILISYRDYNGVDLLQDFDSFINGYNLKDSNFIKRLGEVIHYINQLNYIERAIRDQHISIIKKFS